MTLMVMVRVNAGSLSSQVKKAVGQSRGMALYEDDVSLFCGSAAVRLYEMDFLLQNSIRSFSLWRISSYRCEYG